MPRAKISKITVAHVWDDDSVSHYEIEAQYSETSGPYVSLSTDRDIVHLFPEPWPEIREQIQGLLDEIATESK